MPTTQYLGADLHLHRVQYFLLHRDRTKKKLSRFIFLRHLGFLLTDSNDFIAVTITNDERRQKDVYLLR